LKRVAPYYSITIFPEAKVFFVLLFSIVFTLLSSLNIASNKNVLFKEASESEKEECKVENEGSSEFHNLFGLKKSKLKKKSPPPDVFPIYAPLPPKHSFEPFFSWSACIAKMDTTITWQHDVFGNTPRYIAFHALIFYEV
jgi:hypothetical protein